MVSSIDGRIAASGKSGGIGSKTDRAAMYNLRASADAVIVGAGTLRAEKISLGVPDHLQSLRQSKGKPRQPLSVLIGGTSGLPLQENLVDFDPHNTLVFLPDTIGTPTPQEIPDLKHVELLPISPDGSLDLQLAVGYLRQQSIEFALFEGGPSLNHGLLTRNLVDELFLTISPKLLGGTPQTILEGDLFPEVGKPEIELVSAHSISSELFLRYRLKPL